MLKPSEQIYDITWDSLINSFEKKMYNVGLSQYLYEDFRLGKPSCEKHLKFIFRFTQLLNRSNCITKDQLEKILNCPEPKKLKNVL